MEHKRGWKQFLKLCGDAPTDKELNKFFDFIFTPEEKLSLSSRIELVQALIQGENSQRKIAEELHISIAKITRGSNALKNIDAKLLQWLKQELL